MNIKTFLSIQKHRIIKPPTINKDIPWSFYDGANKENARKCKVGFNLYISNSVYYKFKANMEQVQTTRGH